MKNNINGISTTQQLIVHLFKKQKQPQYIKSTNINKNPSNNNLFNNFKHNILSQNLNGSIKNGKDGIGLNTTNNNFSNRTKYKTSKNSPEHMILQNNLSRQRKLININQAQKQINKLPINNSMNSISKILLNSQRHNNTIKDEIIKKKIMQIKDKKNMTTMNSNNNSMSLNNSISNNNHNNNNSNSNFDYYQNKGIILNIIKNNKNNGYNKINQQQPNSYREIKKRSKSNNGIDNNNNNISNINNYGQFINYEKSGKGKYYNLINKYLSSLSSKHPLRKQQEKSMKSKYNTITAKKIINIKRENSSNKTFNYKGTENFNYEKIRNIIDDNKEKNNNNNITLNQKEIKNKYYLSSTTNNLCVPNQQKQKNNPMPYSHFDLKPLNKTSSQNKQTNRKQSSEKSGQNSMNHNSINHIISSNNHNSPAITMNNRKSNIMNKKNSNSINNNINNGILNYKNLYHYSSNKTNMANAYNNSKYRFTGVYSNSNSKDHSKEHSKDNKNNNNTIKELKKYNVEKIINQLYKHNNNNINHYINSHANKNNNNINNHNNNSLFSNNNNYFIIKKNPEQDNQQHSILKNNFNNSSKNNSASYLYSPKEKKRDINNNMNNFNNKQNDSINIHHVKKNSDNLSSNILNKIKIINGDGKVFPYKNKDSSPVSIKNNNNHNVIIQNSSAKDINNNNNNNNIIIINKNSGNEENDNNNSNKKNENKDNNKDKDKDKEKSSVPLLKKNNKMENFIDKNKSDDDKKIINNNDNNNINNKNIKNDKKDEKEKEESNNNNNNKNRDKDLSCSENDNDPLLEYVNNNIDYIQDNGNNTITESNDSMMNTLKENGKYNCYNKDMEIISNYVKEYYKKNKKYPTTKMKFYKYGRLLGKGAFGKVNLALHILTGRLVAIKSINKKIIQNEIQKNKIKLETNIMKRLANHNNIVKFFECYETKKHICLVMEYICAGDLLSYIKKRGVLQEPVAKFIFKQIILALKCIHENNIVHRDIKLDNILIDLDNNIKICDFGVSRIVNKYDIMLEQCGTPAYIAPEILLNEGYKGFSVDIWSAGVVLYAMLSGTVPFKGKDLKELHDVIISGDYPPIKSISKEATHLIKNILEVDPRRRITTDKILNHPWLIDVDLDFWKNQNLFTNAEYFLLAKSNIDYRNIVNKEDLVENFDLRNLDTIDEDINKNVKTKSFILAPFNTSVSEYESSENNTIPIYDEEKEITDYNNPDLKILNGAMKYAARVREQNRNYELNNNLEIDNGKIKIPNDSDEKNKKEKKVKKDEISPYNGSFDKLTNKPFTPPNENIENSNENNKNNKTKDEFNEKALEIVEKLGYKKEFIKDSIINKQFNYATTSYRLTVKYFFP